MTAKINQRNSLDIASTTNPPLSIFIRLVITGIFLLCTYRLLTTICAPWYQIDLTLECDQEQIFKVYFGAENIKPVFTEKKSTKPKQVPAHARQKVTFKNQPSTDRMIRIDLGELPGTIHIYKIVVHSCLSGKLIYNPADIYNNFKINDQISQYELKNNSVLLVTNGNDPFLTVLLEFPQTYHKYMAGLSFLFSCLLYLYLSSFTVHPNHPLRLQIAIFTDIDDKGPAEGQNFLALDGLRGLGAIYVLAEHSTVCFDGLGGLGVSLFFSLSGFLLIQPFLQDSSRVLNMPYMSNFFLRRVKRIIPVYSFYLFLIYFSTSHYDVFFRHLFFLQGDKQLWTMPQEMFFYLLLPLVLLVFHGMATINKWAGLALFPPLIYLAHSNTFEVHIIHSEFFQLDMVRNISIFLCGMMGALLFKEFGPRFTQHKKTASFSGVFGIIILISFSLLSTGLFKFRAYAHVYPFYYDILAIALILCALLSNGTIFNAFLSSRLLRIVGLVSFSFYIFHYVTIKLVRSIIDYYYGITLNQISLMILAGIASFLIAALSYSFIERPFIRHRNLRGTCQ